MYPCNGITGGFLLCFVLLSLSSNFPTMKTILCIIKNVKNRLHFEYCDCKTGSLLLVPAKRSFRIHNKIKPSCPYHLWKFRKYTVLLHQIWISTKGSLWRKLHNLDLLPFPPPWCPCPCSSKGYSFFSFILIYYISIFSLDQP